MKRFPSEFAVLARQENVKNSFVSDVQAQLSRDCENCGGIGTMSIFLATEGPYEHAAAPYRNDKKSSHFHDGKWWVGKLMSFPCPACRGSGAR